MLFASSILCPRNSLSDDLVPTVAQVEIVDQYSFGSLNFRLLKQTSDCDQHPSTTITAPHGWLVLGGGAYVEWTGPCAPPGAAGNLLTGMYPGKNGTTWTVSSKAHVIPSRASIAAYCIVAQMEDGAPISEDDYRVWSETSLISPYPTMEVDLPCES